MDLLHLIKVACIQMACQPGDVRSNLEKALMFIENAKVKGAHLALLPELFNVGYDLNLLKKINFETHLDYYQSSIAYLTLAARKLNIHIGAGLLEIDNNRLYNSVFIFNEHGILAKYRKLALFPLSGETELFCPGNQVALFDIEGFKFGIMICFDIRFPEISRKYLENQCSCLLVSSAFPNPRIDHWKTLLKSRAIENQIYIAAANRVGIDGNLSFLGNSCIIDPWGIILETADETEETVIIHELDRERIEEVRRNIPLQESFNRLRVF